MKVLKNSKKLLCCFALAGLLLAGSCAASAAPHFSISATELGVAGDPHYARYIDKKGNIPFTFKLSVKKFQTYPLVVRIDLFPYIRGLDKYINTHGGFCNIVKLQPGFSLPPGTSPEVEAQYLRLDGQDLHAKDVAFLNSIAETYIAEQQRCISYEEGALIGLSKETYAHIYDQKCALQKTAGCYLSHVIKGVDGRAEYFSGN